MTTVNNFNPLKQELLTLSQVTVLLVIFCYFNYIADTQSQD